MMTHKNHLDLAGNLLALVGECVQNAADESKPDGVRQQWLDQAKRAAQTLVTALDGSVFVADPEGTTR